MYCHPSHFHTLYSTQSGLLDRVALLFTPGRAGVYSEEFLALDKNSIIAWGTTKLERWHHFGLHNAMCKIG